MDPEFYKRLVALRKKKGVNRRDASRDMDIPYSTLNCYERGERMPRPEQLVTLSTYYGVTVDELLGSEPENDIDPEETDYEALFRLLKESGRIPEDHKMTDADMRFIKSLITQIDQWFE